MGLISSIIKGVANEITDTVETLEDILFGN